MTTILTLIESKTGNLYRKKASTLGGEFSGPCPFCGGEDRFSIHPTKDHYVCRQCKRAGDSIEFLKSFDGLSYLDACKALNITPNISPRPHLDPTDPKHQQRIMWQPRPVEYPPDMWQSKAEAVLFSAYQYLMSAAGRQHRDWLNARGINNSTIKTARMGWITVSVNFDRESWGLLPETDAAGKHKTVWVPAGLIIPLFHAGRPIRLRIRQENPISSDRYIVVPGSSMGFFDYMDHTSDSSADPARPSIITEAELDGWLLHQELGDNLRVYAVGNSSARPDQSAHEYISRHPALINLDNDAAGRQELPWWQKQYPKSIPWLSEFGKDPGESFEVGDDIRAWGLSGLSILNQQFPADPGTITISHENGMDHRQRIIEKYSAKSKQTTTETMTKIKNNKSIEQTTSTTSTFKKIIYDSDVCVHEQYCQNLKNNLCMVNNFNPWNIDFEQCPKNQWYKIQTGSITQVILAPGVSKNKKKAA